MSKVIQIRDVPEDVHEALAAAAHQEGLSLTRYALRELTQSAARAASVKANAVVIRQTQAALGRPLNREVILSALQSGRDE